MDPLWIGWVIANGLKTGPDRPIRPMHFKSSLANWTKMESNREGIYIQSAGWLQISNLETRYPPSPPQSAPCSYCRRASPPSTAAAVVPVRPLKLLPSCQSTPCSCCRRASPPALDIRPAATTKRLPLAAVTGRQIAVLELGSRQSSSPAVVHHFEKITKGRGIHRMKQHLAGVKGDIGPYKSVPPDVRFRMENSLQEFVNSKKATQEAYEERNFYGPNVSQFEGDMAEGEEEVQEMQSPMAASSGKRKKSIADKYFVSRNTQGAQPSMRSVLAGKEATWRANMAVGRFFYDACIPTNAMNSFYFKPMLDAISAIGPGYKGPNYHQLRVNLLKDAKKEVQLLVDSYRAIWAKVGCTIMGDGWTDNRQRTLINFLVYCPEGISFVKFVDASDIVKDASNLFLLFDAVIEWVGPLNVVHIVTNNAANYVAAGRLISQKHKHINWSPCAAHCLNLIFKDISKMNHVAELVRRASKDNKSKVAVSIILDNRFWNDCLIVVNLMSPLMRLLRIVDCDERPSMGYVYEGMYRKNIHSAAYWFNPCFQYDQENFCNKPTVIGGVMDVIDQKVLKGKLETMNEMKLFRDRLGSFGRDHAYSSREVLQPVDDDQPAELDVEELETLLYEEGSIPINEVEGSSSHVDNEDGGDVAIEGLDVENFGFLDAYFQSPYSNFQNE
ncbi:hypothetical protein CK203_109069 [Vitis vinifera]|uniref:DUF659 domain-containing protein n=1 Tax=Vitis vinifera TaxID=29760 RepID=A0A438CYU9_VITVI|nr:hypothetical protein CK203_109069 [Vitis vinifera]